MIDTTRQPLHRSRTLDNKEKTSRKTRKIVALAKKKKLKGEEKKTGRRF